MSAQLDRVNDASARRQLELLQSEVEQLRRSVQLFAAENARLRARIDEHSAGAPDVHGVIVIDGRPCITPQAAARQVGVSVPTVNRYLQSGYWQGVQQRGSNRWYVFADQPLSRKRHI